MKFQTFHKKILKNILVILKIIINFVKQKNNNMNMKRKDCLENYLTEDKNVKNVIETTLSEDKKFIKREYRNIKDKIEDIETELSTRLKSSTPIDKSVIEVLYQSLVTKKALLETYKSFNKEFEIVDSLD